MSEPRDAMVDLAIFGRDLRYEDLPKATVEVAKKLFLDWLGCAVAGIRDDDVARVAEVVRQQGGVPEATAIGFGDRLPISEAVFLNSVISRALEIDDVHDTALNHPGVMVHPVALALAEAEPQMTGKDMIVSIVAAYEIACRITMAPELGVALNGHAYHHGGAFAAVGMAARHYGFSLEKLLAGMGIAYGLLSGNQQGVVEGKMTVRMGTAFIARAGIIAARLARAGVNGPVNVLEGRYGYYKLYHGNAYDRDRLVSGLGESFEIDRIHIKPYALCLYTHPPIAAALEILEEAAFGPEDVERVVVRSNQEHYNMVYFPADEKKAPADVITAQFSTPYAVACALVRRSAWLDELQPDVVNDPIIRALSAKVDVVVDEEMESIDARTIRPPAVVEVHLKDGSTHRRRVDHPRGHADNPMTYADVADKYKRCMAWVDGPSAETDRTIETIARLEELQDARDLFAGLPGLDALTAVDRSS